MMNEIMEGCELEVIRQWTTIHNYIEPETNMLRKIVISVHKGKLLINPLNMKDGSIVGIRKGTKEWNDSTPHGAGCFMSRQQAKKTQDKRLS